MIGKKDSSGETPSKFANKDQVEECVVYCLYWYLFVPWPEMFVTNTV